MNRLAALLLLATISPIAAQESTILGFTDTGNIVWTNTETNVYASLYFTWDLRDQWFPVWVNRLVTNTAEIGPTHLSMLGGDETNVYVAITAGQFDTTRTFYRITSSTTPLPLPNITNDIVVINASTTAVTDIYLGICWGNVAVSNVAPCTTSDIHTVSAPFQWAWDYRYGSSLIFDDDVCLFFQGQYFQQGIRKDLYFPFQFFAIPGYTLIITISNQSYTVENKELPTRIALYHRKLALPVSSESERSP